MVQILLFFYHLFIEILLFHDLYGSHKSLNLILSFYQEFMKTPTRVFIELNEDFKIVVVINLKLLLGQLVYILLFLFALFIGRGGFLALIGVLGFGL